jgi:hypothetical protein
MLKGHLVDQTHMNLRSTKATKATLIPPKPEADAKAHTEAFPSSPHDSTQTHLCCANMIDTTGQTGKFVTPFTTGSNDCFLVGCHFNSNVIDAILVKSKHPTEITKAHKIFHAKLRATSCHPRLQCLDNKCSETLKDHMHEELSRCSEGNLWQQFNSEEIGRLAQGLGNIAGTNTTFFIPPASFKLSLPAAPKTQIPVESAGLLVAIKPTSQTALAPNLLEMESW